MKKIILALLLCLMVSGTARAAEPKESAYDRIVRTKTLRCGYVLYPTLVEKDPNTGKFSGLFYELVNELGRQLNLKVEWTEEVGFDGMFEGFKTGRYDALCAGYSATPARAWSADFTKPLVYMPYHLYIKAGDARFKAVSDFDNVNVSIATTDGEMSQIASNEHFPKAKQKSLPGTTAATDRMTMVATGKADVTPMETSVGKAYIAQNPGKIQQFGTEPFQVLGSVVMIPRNEYQLKQTLDSAIDTMIWTGAIARIVKKYEQYPGTMLLPSAPYQVQSQ